MKKLFSTLCVAILLPMSVLAQNQTTAQKPVSFLQVDDYADGSKYLPAPPDTASVQYLNDFSRYQWGKSMRNTPRGGQSVKDASLGGENFLRAFQGAFGISLSKERTPEIYKLLASLDKDAGLSTKKAKNFYMRKRPYVQFHEPTNVPEDEASHIKSGSFPSAHSAAGWAAALVLAEIDVEHQDAILKRGFEIGESRVITGYHYQSDVDYARLAGAACVARLHADKGFQIQLEKAKKEYNRLKTKNTSK